MMQNLISRQAAIDALERKKDKTTKGDIGGFYNQIIQNDIEALMKLPSAEPYTEAEIQKMQELEQAQLQTAYELGKQEVQPKRKNGRWIKSKEHDHLLQCSECEYEVTIDMAYEYNYCPLCGADMRGERDE